MPSDRWFPLRGVDIQVQFRLRYGYFEGKLPRYSHPLIAVSHVDHALDYIPRDRHCLPSSTAGAASVASSPLLRCIGSRARLVESKGNLSTLHISTAHILNGGSRYPIMARKTPFLQLMIFVSCETPDTWRGWTKKRHLHSRISDRQVSHDLWPQFVYLVYSDQDPWTWAFCSCLRGNIIIADGKDESKSSPTSSSRSDNDIPSVTNRPHNQ